jgi:hypothetical protein
MPFRPTDFPYLFRNHPDELTKMMGEAFHKTEGDVVKASMELGLSLRQWYQYVTKLELLDEFADIRQHYRALRRSRRLGLARRDLPTRRTGGRR